MQYYFIYYIKYIIIIYNELKVKKNKKIIYGKNNLEFRI